MTTGQSRGPQRSRPRDNNRPSGVATVVSENVSRWVRVTCPTCGVVRVRADRVVVRNCLDDGTWSYRAVCSTCETIFVDATPEALALPAIVAGLPVELWTRPRPSARHEGLPFHLLDVLELHLALMQEDWFDELARVKSPRKPH